MHCRGCQHTDTTSQSQITAPELRLSQAVEIEIKDEEQAVSMDRQGPCKFKK